MSKQNGATISGGDYPEDEMREHMELVVDGIVRNKLIPMLILCGATDGSGKMAFVSTSPDTTIEQIRQLIGKAKKLADKDNIENVNL